jgi:hypothetical protein
MDPQDVIGQLLRMRGDAGAPEQTPAEIVDWRFPKPMHWDDFLKDSPESENIIDRRVGAEDENASPQDYIAQMFQELKDPRVR